MANQSINLWDEFLGALSVVGINISPDNFKLSNGLQIANWQLLNYTGINDDYKGQIDVPNLFKTADYMPDFNNFTYLPINSFYDQYTAYVNAIKVTNPPDLTLESAKNRLFGYTMGTPNTYPGYLISPNLYDFFLSSLQNTTGTPKLHFTMSLENNESEKRTTKVAYENTSLPNFIQLKKGTQTMERTANFSTSTNNQKTASIPEATLEFTAQNVQTFSVSPDRWFNSAMITNYYDKIDPNSALANKDIFGENGVLSNRIVNILVVFKRTVVITASKEQLEGLHNANYLKSSDNAVNIGGFTFEGGDTTNFTAQTSTYTYTDNSNAPYIMGFQVVNLGPTLD